MLFDLFRLSYSEKLAGNTAKIWIAHQARVITIDSKRRGLSAELTKNRLELRDSEINKWPLAFETHATTASADKMKTAKISKAAVQPIPVLAEPALRPRAIIVSG